MKLVTFEKNASICAGALTDKGIADLTGRFQSVKEILTGGPETLEKIRSLVDDCAEFIDQSKVKLLAPIPNPPKILALAGNYSEHIAEAGLSLGLSDSTRSTTVPRPFIMPSNVIISPGEEIPWRLRRYCLSYQRRAVNTRSNLFQLPRFSCR